jgi:alanine racemase
VELVERAAAAAGRRASVHLKVDTGLGRQGATPDEAVEVASRIARSRHLALVGTFSHLAVPGEDDAYTDVKLLRLAQALDAMRSAGVDPGLVHVSSTGGLLAGLGGFADAVRPGLGLYGMLPDWAADRDPGLRPVLSIRALPLRLFDLPAGASLGYGLRFRAERATRIATLCIGYGDGWPRVHANNGRVLVHGRVAPIVRQPVEGVLDLLRLDRDQVVERAARRQLAGDAGGGDGRPAAVRLEPHLRHAAVAHPQEEAREVPAAGVLVLPRAVGLAHEPGVARVEEVVDQRGAVPHRAPAGTFSRSLRTIGSTHSIT